MVSHSEDLPAARPASSGNLRSSTQRSSLLIDMDGDAASPLLWLAGYAVLLLGLAIVFVSSWFSLAELSTSLKLIFMALFVLTVKRWTGAVLLALIQVYLLFLPQWALPMSGLLSNLFWVCTPLALVSLISRYRTIQDLQGGSPIGTVLQIRQTLRRHRSERSRTIADNVRGQLRQLVRHSVVVVTCLVAAMWLLGRVPLPESSVNFDTIAEFRLRPTGYRTLILGFLLFAGWLPLWLIMNEATWRRHLPAQARMYLRGIFIDWNHRDLRSIIRRRIKIRQRYAQPVSSDSATPVASPPNPFSEPTMGFEGRIL